MDQMSVLDIERCKKISHHPHLVIRPFVCTFTEIEIQCVQKDRHYLVVPGNIFDKL